MPSSLFFGSTNRINLLLPAKSTAETTQSIARRSLTLPPLSTARNATPSKAKQHHHRTELNRIDYVQ